MPVCSYLGLGKQHVPGQSQTGDLWICSPIRASVRTENRGTSGLANRSIKSLDIIYAIYDNIFIYYHGMKEIGRIFRALSDPTRLRAFLLLMERDLCVCELIFILDMSQSRVSHQLKPLRDADLVETRREGRWIIYSIPGNVKRTLAPFLRQYSSKDIAESKAVIRDLERLKVCLQKNIRKTCGKEVA